MRTDAFIDVLVKEPNEFFKLFNNLFFHVENDSSIDLVKEINNITFTFRFMDMLNITNNEKVRKLFSFQVAYIIEKIKQSDIDISLFLESLHQNSIKPYLDFYLKRKNINQNGLAYKLHETFIMLIDVMNKNYNSEIKDIESERVFVNDVSKWSKGDLPEFLKILTINVVMFFDQGKIEQRSQLVLMLILRALIYIKRIYKVSNVIEKQFLDEVVHNREVIQQKLYEKDYDGLELLKLDNCIDFEKILIEIDNHDLDVKILFKYSHRFFTDIKECNLDQNLEKRMIDFILKHIKWHS